MRQRQMVFYDMYVHDKLYMSSAALFYEMRAEISRAWPRNEHTKYSSCPSAYHAVVHNLIPVFTCDDAEQHGDGLPCSREVCMPDEEGTEGEVEREKPLLSPTLKPKNTQKTSIFSSTSWLFPPAPLKKLAKLLPCPRYHGMLLVCYTFCPRRADTA